MSKLLDNYVRDLKEFQAGYTGLTFFKPDTSGIRGKGLNRKAYQAGDDEYPYGDAEPNWGEPWSYSRDSSGHGSSRQPVPVPRHISSDDERWNDGRKNEMGVDGTPPQGNIVDDPPRSRSKFGIDSEKELPWQSPGLDELIKRLENVDMEEAMGVPFSPARGNQGTGGMHSGGRTQPGSSGEWSARPKLGHWDQRVDLDDEENFSEYNYGLPFSGDVTRRTPTMSDEENPDDHNLLTFVIPTDDDTEETDGIDAMMKRVGNPKFQQSPGMSTKYHRMVPGLTWKEGLHRGLVEAFVSLKDVPDQRMSRNSCVSDVDLDFSKNTFKNADMQARNKFDRVDEPELVRFLIQIEPDHFMKSLGEIGKDKLVDIYETWVSDILEGDRDSIEKMAERIMKAVGAG